ncbi:MAG: prolipoprotein diacylglyceryl transferase [Candidatus Omnitrophota bacterium]
MHPVLFKLGLVQIYSYGAMMAVAFLVFAYFASRRAGALGMNGEEIINLSIYLIISGLIGSRILFILLNLDYYRQNHFEIFMVWKGGLVWYGGFISALAASLIYMRAKRMPVIRTLDLLMPYLALGQSMGRIGCFLNGCCYGKSASLHMGVVFNETQGPVYPTQLYESAAMFVVFLILRKRVPGDGRTLLLYLVLYSSFRFFVEFLRGDNPSVMMGLTISQLISIAVFISAVILWKSAPSK